MKVDIDLFLGSPCYVTVCGMQHFFTFIALIRYCSNLDYRHTLGKDTHESKPHGTPNTLSFQDTHTYTLRGSVPRSTFTVLPNINPVKSDVQIVPFIYNPVSLLLGTDPNHFILG